MTDLAPSRPGILAIDIGTKLGWDRITDPADLSTRRHGVLDFSELHPDRWRRMDLYARWLTREVTEHPIGLVAIEEPFTASIDNVGTRHVLHGMFVFAQVICLRLGIEVRAVSRFDVFRAVVGWCSTPAPERKTKTGRPGRRSPSKTEIRKAINARHGLSIRSEDEADAMAIGDLILAERAGSGPVVAAVCPRNHEPVAPTAHGEMVPLDHGESLPRAPVPPALAQLRAAQDAVPLERLKAPARRKLEAELAKMGIGAALALPQAKRKARGRTGTRRLF